MAHQRGGFSHLANQANHHQRFDVMRKGRGSDLQLVLQAADRQTRVARANQRSVDFKPGRIAQGFEVCCCVIKLHCFIVASSYSNDNHISRIMELSELDSTVQFHDSRFMETDQALGAFAALSQDTRLEAFRLLIKHEPQGVAAGELARLLSVPQNTLSAHLNVLTHANLVTSERRSRSIIYRARLDRLEALLLFLMQDCCNGRPDVSTQVMKSVAKQFSATRRER